MKEEALKLADELDVYRERVFGQLGLKADHTNYGDLIRKLVAHIEKLEANPFGDDYVVVCKRCGDKLGIMYEEKK